MRVALVVAINAQLVLAGAGLEQRPVPDPVPPGAATEIFGDWASPHIEARAIQCLNRASMAQFGRHGRYPSRQSSL
jgi:hypothetical protein